MNKNLKFHVRIEDGLWTNTNKIMDPVGAEYTVIMDRYYDSAQILNSAGALVGSITQPTGKADMVQALKNYLISDLGCVFAVDNAVRSTTAVVIVPESLVYSLIADPFLPNSGVFTLTTGSSTTAAIGYDADSGDVEDALAAIGLTVATVSGDLGNGMTIDLVNAPGVTLSVATNTLISAQEQQLSFSDVPDAGQLTVSYDSTQVIIVPADTASSIKTKFASILPDLDVHGDFTSGLLFTFLNTMDPDEITQVSNTMTASSVPVVVNFTTGTDYQKIDLILTEQ